MRIVVGVVVVLMAGGCASLTKTPDPVLLGGRMQAQGLVVLRASVETVVDNYAAKYTRALQEGYREFLASEAEKMADTEGRVDLGEYNAFLEDLAEDLNAKTSANEAEAARVKATLGEQFSAVQSLGAGVQEYNEATGVTDESWSALVESGQALGDAGADLYLGYRSRKTQEKEAEHAAQAAKRGSAMDFFAEVQKAIQNKQPADPGWIREALEAVQSGKPIPPYPAAPSVPEETQEEGADE